MSRTIELQYWIRDRVHIPELKQNGKINAIFIGDDGLVQYRVRHFKDGDSKEAYFDSDELTPNEGNKPPLGFAP